MNRKAEIKERSKGINEYMHDADKAEIHRQDVEYLLSRLEIAEKALERMSTGNFSAPMEYSQIEAYQKYAESTLEQIRS